MTLEQRIARAILGLSFLGLTRASALMSDAYKWAMAQAGFPLREETFVLTLRRGGPYYIPFDCNAIVQELLPSALSAKESAFLTANGYGLNPAMETALAGKVRVTCPPKASWVGKGEPIMSVTGPSFLVSWLEPLLIMLQYPIQIATAIVSGKTEFPVTCEDEREIVQAIGEGIPGITTPMDTKGYLERVRKNVQDAIDALGGEAHRAFEVGLRAATCMQQHLMVLEVCRSLGVLKTSNVYGAWKLYMIPVGTTGHEHQMRWGCHDLDDCHGFRAIRDMRPEPPSYLFDTTDPINRGIPAALKVMREALARLGTMRFDSGDQDAQFLKILAGVLETPALREILTLIFEDGYTAEKTRRNEAFCDQHNWPRERRMYGYGGNWVSQPALTPYNRDAASAAYKLARTGGVNVQKFSGSKGKVSVPGLPVILESRKDIFHHLIAQEGETVEGFNPLGPSYRRPSDIVTEYSPQTLKIAEAIMARKEAA